MNPTITRPIEDGELPTATRGHVGAFLVVALDCGQPLRRPLRIALDALTEVRIGRGARRSVEAGDAPGQVALRLPDGWMSSAHLRLRRVGSTWLYEDDAAKNVTLVNGVACQQAILTDGDVLMAGGTLLLFLLRHVDPAAPVAAVVDAEAERQPPGLATLVPALAETFAITARVALSNVAVLIRGETGTGKEVLARAVHARSARDGAFVPVNCGALPATLVESELFGARKGAYSGISEDRPGLIRASDGGTLFLDEVAELPAAAQAALLRVLQDGEVRPLGQHHAVQVSLRLVCATHRDLEAMIEAGQFRRDLYARLAGHIAALPPLRERREDLGLLLAELLERHAPERAAGLRIAPAAARALFAHGWPMNVRELEQLVVATLAHIQGTEIGLAQLPAALRDGAARAPAALTPAMPHAPAEPPGARVAALLREHHGNVTAVARVLETSRSQVRRLARRAGIAIEALRDDDGSK